MSSGVRPGKIVAYTGTATAADTELSAVTGSSKAGGYKAKIKTTTASLTLSFDNGKTRFTQATSDGWQEYEGLFSKVIVSDSGGTAVYTVVISTVA